MPLNASVSEDAIGAIEMLFSDFFNHTMVRMC